MEKLIEYLKNVRKRGYISNTYKSKYAFVGIGNHSINNLYPVINFLRADLKYIVTNSKANADLVNNNFDGLEGTNDLQKVLDDNEISGIFVCASPKAHFKLVKQILEADKNVFVEKPPCMSIDELNILIDVEKKSKASCFVGLQKQYAPANIKLKKKLKQACTYNYRYVTGAYPEGDVYMDIFIHPIALITFLFGEAELQFMSDNRSKAGTTAFLNIKHKNGANGVIELSTDYSWTNAEETLIVNTPKGIFKMKNTEELSFSPKQGTFMGLPTEKIFGDKMTTINLSMRSNFNPIFDNNQLYSSGYYSEIKNFLNFCENKNSINNTSLISTLNTYQIINDINKNYVRN